MQAIKLALQSMLSLKQSIVARLKAELLARYERASRVFRRSLRPLVISKNDQRQSCQPCGWMIPNSAADSPASYEIHLGTNYLLKDEGWSLSRSSGCVDPVAKLQLSDGQLSIHHGAIQKQYYHGDQIDIGEQRFTVKLFSSYEFKKLLMNSLLALVFISHGIDAACGQSVTHATQAAQAYFGEPVSLSFELKGIERMDAADLSAKISVNKVDYPAKIASVSVPASENVFLIDTSSLCITRRMEALINAELYLLLSSFAPTSVVSVVEFSRKNDLQDVRDLYRRTFDRQLAKDVLKTPKLIHCLADGRSVNALDAVVAQKDLFVETQSDFSHRRLFIISSGNIMPNPEAKTIIQKSAFEIYPVVYSPVALSYVEQSFGDLPSSSQVYQFRWWSKPESLAISKGLSYRYQIEVIDQLPKSVQSERSYVVDLSLKKADQSHQLYAELDLRIDKGRQRIEEILWTLCLFAFAILSIYLVCRIIRYYRTPVCPVTAKAMSRTWNRSLHHLRPKQSVLYIEDDEGYRLAHVIDKPLVHVHSRFGSDVYLPKSLIPHGITISCHKDVVYAVRSSSREDLVRINGRDCKGSVNLSHADVIELGHCRIYFLLAA